MRETDQAEPTTNFILRQLPKPEYKRLASELEYTPLDLGTVLYETGADRDYVYFPTTGIVSILEMLQDGASSEISLIEWPSMNFHTSNSP